jgi:hypothetical protein
MPHFEVIGEDWSDYDIEGEEDDDEDVEGSVMGYAGPMGDYEGSAIVGYDEFGEPIILDGDELVGARRRRRRRRPKRRRRAVVVKKPRWRQAQLAPGVIAPDQGLLPLPMGEATFISTGLAAYTFQGQIQKPFRGERLLVETVRSGTTSNGRIMGQLFVGTDLQQMDVNQFDIEAIGNPNAFGVRLTMKPAQPGVFIRLVTNITIVPTSTDYVYANVTLLGRAVH